MATLRKLLQDVKAGNMGAVYVALEMIAALITVVVLISLQLG